MSELIIKELKNRRRYLKVSFWALIFFSLFLCVNHYLPYDHSQKRTHLRSGIPVQVSAPDSDFRDFEVSEQSEISSVQSRLVSRFNTASAGLENRQEYNQFAALLAHEAANNGWPEDYKISLLSHVIFPKQENQIKADYLKLSNTLTESELESNIFDYIVNKGVIEDSRIGKYRYYGLGFASKGNRLICVIFLVRPILKYADKFPNSGVANMVATLEDNSISKIEIDHHYFTRGWMSPANEALTPVETVVSADTVTFQLTPPKQGWSNIEFIVDGEPIGPGRVLLPNGAYRKDVKAIDESTYFENQERLNNELFSTLLEPSPSASDQSVLGHINKSRLEQGLAALVLNDTASKAAQLHCDETVERGYIGHWGKDGSKPYHRYHRLGGTGGVSENLAWFCQRAYEEKSVIPCDRKIDASKENLIILAKRSHDAFMAERPPNDGHRTTVLNPYHTSVGIGYAISKGRFSYCEEYVAQYIELASDMQAATLGQVVTLSGRVLDPQSHGVYAISITYDPPLSEYLDKNQPDSYPNYGVAKVKSFAPWEINYQADTGNFSTSFKPTKSGLYYVQYFIKEDPKNIPYQPSASASYNTADSFVGGAQVVRVSD